MKVVAFNGSTRLDGNTATLIRCAFQVLEQEGIETELVQLAGSDIRGCTGCRRCAEARDRRCARDNDAANSYMEKMACSDGILLGSPTYFSDVTTEMKALIERCGTVAKANGDVLRRKVGAAIVAGARAGSLHAFDTMNHFFTISQMIIPGSSYWNVGLGFDRGDVERDRAGLHTMRVLGENMAWLLRKLA